jgi:hypothetical protein
MPMFAQRLITIFGWRMAFAIFEAAVLLLPLPVLRPQIRAFNSETGELLWEGELPLAGTATPATYLIDGKQYIVIATSGQRDHKGPQGAAYVAFALP